MFGDELIDFVLREVEGSHFAAHCIESVAVWITQSAQVSGIHLSMTAEATKILINDSRVEKGKEAGR